MGSGVPSTGVPSTGVPSAGVCDTLWTVSSRFVRFGLTVLLFAGVSNWGGYAIACALHVLRCCDIHERYLRRAVGFPRAPGERLWLPALPSVTKVIPVRRGLGFAHGREREVATAAQSCLVRFNTTPSQGPWGLLGIPCEGTATLSLDCLPQRIQDRLQIKILQYECIHV